jgi:hypothetical protein
MNSLGISGTGSVEGNIVSNSSSQVAVERGEYNNYYFWNRIIIRES